VDRRRSGALVAALLALAAAVGACAETGASGEAVPSSTTTTERPTSTTRATTTTTAPPTTTTARPTTTEAPPRPVAVTTTRPPSPPITAQPQVLPYAATVEGVTAQELHASWRPGCPLHHSQLRAVDVRHFGYDGAVHTGRLIVAADRAQAIVAIFRDLYAARFPIQRMEPIDVYGGDDNRSMDANNTSAFNCRAVTGGTGWSEHAYGRAIDVNPFVNPYVRGGTVLPPRAARYADRSRREPGMIHAGDAVVDAFAARGWSWGGYWTSLKDYQHFSTTGR
jgi:hypothetical protein